MSTECYPMLRGSALRVTAQSDYGSMPEGPVRYAASRSAVRVNITEVSDGTNADVMRDEYNRPRVALPSREDTASYMIDADFLRVDPGLLHLMTGVPIVLNAAGDIAGFDAETRLPATAFGLEVWSNIGRRDRWGYTLFPYLMGGYVSGFAVTNGLISFNLRKALTRRGSKWSVGPYDISGPWQRLDAPVSGNSGFSSHVTALPPPLQTDGWVEFDDSVHGGDATSTTPDILAGGSADSTSHWIVNGGVA